RDVAGSGALSASQAARYGGPQSHAARSATAVNLPAEGLSLKETLDRLERDYIREALTRANGNRAQAASLLGLNRTTLVEKLRRMSEASPPPGALRRRTDGTLGS